MASKKSWRAKGLRMRKYSDRLAKKQSKKVSKVFSLLLKQIQKNNKDSFSKIGNFNINLDYFEKSLNSVLNLIFIENTQLTIPYVNELFGWKLDKEELNIVRSKAIESYNKKLAAKKVAGITKTTRNTIKSIIEKGQLQGLNKKEIAKELKTSIEGMSKSRSLRIARTETSNAVNISTNKTATSAGMSEKGWIYTDIAISPRANHQALDGTWIKLDEQFDLGGMYADYPHDPNLPASEVVNCRCICVYR